MPHTYNARLVESTVVITAALLVVLSLLRPPAGQVSSSFYPANVLIGNVEGLQAATGAGAF